MQSKVLLITTSFEGIKENKIAETSEEMHYPLGLAYLHSYLESKKHQVECLALNHKTKEVCLKEIIKRLEIFSPELVGFQVLTSTRVSTYEAIDYLIKHFPKIKIVLGGIHATIMHKQLIEKYPQTLVVLGEGEVTMHELAIELKKKRPSFKKIDGLAYSLKGKAVRNKKRELIKDLDSLPFPNHKDFLTDKKRKMASILTSRGCFFACSFCCLNPEARRIVRVRSPKNVVDEIEYILQSFSQIEKIFIRDDSFFVDNVRVIEICKEIIKRKIKINLVCSGRMKPLSKEMIGYLEKAGFKEVLLGLESGDEGILKKCHKGITQKDVINAFTLFSKSSITVRIFLIVGLPGETFETIKETARLVKKIQRIKYFPMIDDFNLLTIYPGTEVYEIAKQKKFIDDSYWLTNKPTPLYLAENNLRDLSLFKEYLSTNLSVYKIFTLEGFKANIK